MLHLATRYRVGDHLVLLLITLVDGRTNTLISTARGERMSMQCSTYQDSRIEARAPTKKESFRRSGTFLRYRSQNKCWMVQRYQPQLQRWLQKQSKSTSHSSDEFGTRGQVRQTSITIQLPIPS